MNDPQPTSDAKVPGEAENPKYNRENILKQYRKEKIAAMKVRQVKINNWLRNEELYNGVTQRTLLTRSNLHVPKVFEGVHTMASRLGEVPDCSYETVPEGDDNAADIMKHLFIEDAKKCNWDLSYENGKIEGGIYGRGIWKLIPGNNGCRWELIDTMAYLISPIAKNTKDALYQGQQFIYKTMPEIEKDAKKFGYDMTEVQKLKDQKVPQESQADTSSEASSKNNRMAHMGLANVTQYGSKVAEITEWYTYLNQDDSGEKEVLPYVLTVANDEFLLRAIPLKDTGLPRMPFVAFGVYTRGITFWCPSVADIYRDPNLAMDVSLNQGIDNSTYRNFGMMFVASSSGLKQGSIVPRPLGVTPVTVGPDEKVQDKVWQFTPPEVATAASMMAIINSFADSAAGLSASTIGQKGKMTVTQQAALQAQVEMKTNVIRKNLLLACEELYQLYADTMKLNLTEPRQVKIFGYKQITLDGVTKKNFEGVKFLARATPSETSQENKAIKQKARIELYNMFKDDPKVPGQIAMRRDMAKQFDIPPTVIESFFTEDEKQPGQEEKVALEQGQEGQADNIKNPPNPLLSQTQRGAQAQVPMAIK